jgi:hypothetical protein
MALTGHFLNFNEEVGRIRKNMVAEIYSMMNSLLAIECNKGDFGATLSDGDHTVTNVRLTLADCVVIVTEEGNEVDVTELSTDDMVALYEFIFGCLNQIEMVTKYDVLSPDGYSISFSELWDTPEEAQKALNEWVKGYERQGYYSTTNRERIPLDELTTWCRIVPIEIEK